MYGVALPSQGFVQRGGETGGVGKQEGWGNRRCGETGGMGKQEVWGNRDFTPQGPVFGITVQSCVIHSMAATRTQSFFPP